MSGNVATVLHILQHGIELDYVHTPAAAEEYASRLAQRGIPMAALLRAYRLGAAQFQDWCLEELGRRTDNASIVSVAGLRIADTTAAYIDQVSEELVSAYEAEKETWLPTSTPSSTSAPVAGSTRPGQRPGRHPAAPAVAPPTVGALRP